MHCGICKRELAKDEAVYRLHLGDSYFRITGKNIGTVCAQCAVSKTTYDGRVLVKHWPPSKPCECCGRPVHVDRHRKHLRYFVCSDQCRIAIYNANARAKLKRQGERPVPKQACVICGALFTPKRSDAIYCSAACKQRGYRRKQTQRAAPAP